ncbi:ABC transporter ATP-binding protein [Alkalicoccobacillus murimartini]|uniref:ABC-2 type transport system ATP-binding protein n=1 Tax=Alkalicoccobacillus murimartini TaxID=171685 RepID=A0ABT9YMC6_9BACI|nr:ABC transporter ATP-binding protein [Alkalicoccobacillus murimartini]MDQ0208347.1 ABC-2 type transport system ATP-binding protein [Alkalicoccobacillus murimartini]
MLEVVSLSKRFKQLEAVKGVSLYLEKGESVGLLGPNGAGKSTAISMISTLIKPTEGNVLFLGESMIKHPKKLREAIGLVPQDLAVFPQLTAEDNLLFFGKMYAIPTKQLKQRVNELLIEVGLEERKKDKVKTFSGGMKRRLNIAIALIHRPEILIMDEPTVGIDPQSRNFILKMVRRLQKEEQMTVLYTSHYMEEVEYVCDRVYIMDRGSMIAAGTKDEVKGILRSEETIEIHVNEMSQHLEQTLRSHPNISSVVAEQPTYTIVTNQADMFDEVIEMATEAKVKLIGIQAKPPTLEDVFLHLTGRKLRD